MDSVLMFFSSLILFTAGIFVCLAWLVIIWAIVAEVYSLVFNVRSDNTDEEDE